MFQTPLDRFRQNNQQVLPSLDDAAPNSQSAVAGNQSDVLTYSVFFKYQLEQDLLRLKAIDGIPEKIAAKKEMLKNYQGLIKDFLAGKQAEKNVLTQLMIWLFDVGEIENALATAFRLIEVNQPMPRQFSSDMKTFVCDYTYDWANALYKQKLSASPYLDSVVETIEADFWDLAPMVKSKMFALLAKFRFEEGKFADVVAFCQKAEAANKEGHGTKTLRERAEKELKRV